MALTINKVIWCKNEGRPRTAQVIDNNIKHVCLSEFLTRDLVPLEANILVGGIFKKVVLASAYFAGDREAQEVLDVTFGSYFWCGLISKWRVSPEPSLSDHKIILFDLKGSTLQQVPKRNPRGTDWES